MDTTKFAHDVLEAALEYVGESEHEGTDIDLVDFGLYLQHR